MRDTLVILNYQREIPPFMQNLIRHAADQFRRILYFTPELYNDNRASCGCEKLEVIQCPRSKWRRALMKSPAFCLLPEARVQIRTAREHGQNLRNVYRQIIRHSVCGDTLFQEVYPYLARGAIQPSETVVMAAWFSTEAYAAAKIKKLFPACRVMSFAHSFEINRDQNPIVLYDMNRMKHRGADGLVFISRRMREIYYREAREVYPELSDRSWQTRYLGSSRRFPDAVSHAGEDGIFRLVSCSSVVPVKRLYLLIGALAAWQGEEMIHWTHIGGGALLEDVKRMAHQQLDGKPRITYTFTGALTNEEVQRYYTEHPVDLLVNVSAIEGLPVSLMECMSYGIPVLATDVGGTAEIVREETGFLLPKEFDTGAFHGALRSYLDMGREEKEAMRRSCLALWEKEFDAGKNARSLFAWLKSE